ncbi:CRISPR-associated endoribonuclease Cas6 [Anabaena cylindrica UHCC 0172]|uniref:CRISPR-associated endoribonuclease Cas6 n=1 Tax=Anabaena cylindrica TaxID=1165 RepID=UPI002B1F5829|nr:CRISPR-associated endoribonuclease Cas6 [Anabaena cylindrica]MEA5554345.1 CRISPR-associated endoribonuclease Cas6 [Anabaena cylindrica UHCC 0172]
MPRRATSSKRATPSENNSLVWADNAELVGLVFELEAIDSASLYSQYTIGLHAWFLDQVRQINPTLSAYLHDGESEKPFNISALAGQLVATGKQLQLQANHTYRWHLNAISQPVVQFLSQWLTQPLPILKLRDASLQIKQVSIVHPPTTYTQLLQSSIENQNYRNINLSFISPTSFRRKGHHFPLPVPFNLFHSYLRRWNDFSGMPIEQDAFLNWIDENVIIHKHRLESVKVAAGKRGSVTGFTGAISLGLSKTALANIEFTQLFYALVQLAPYCGTGHKTTFGLGQTCLDWVKPESNISSEGLTNLLPERIEQLTAIFTAQRKRTGGERAEKIATTWATILARREMGESLQVIAQDLEIPYTTAKTYVKLARRTLKDT